MCFASRYGRLLQVDHAGPVPTDPGSTAWWRTIRADAGC